MSTYKPLDDRQVENRAALSTSIGTAANTTLDVIFSTIDSEMVNLSGVQSITNKTIGVSSSNLLSNTLQFDEISSTPATDPSSGNIALYAKTDGNFYTLNSSGLEKPLSSPVYFAPTVQRFTSTGTQTGTLFDVSAPSSNVSSGAVYSNNSNNYTVLVGISTLQSGYVLYTSGTGTLSGTTLTKVSGTGPTTITFSASEALATYTTPTSPAPLYLEITVQGGGGGGGGSGITGGFGGTGGTGGISVFGADMIAAYGGTGGANQTNAGGTGGIALCVTATPISTLQGGSGANSVTNNTTTEDFSFPGGMGAASPFGGAGGSSGSNAISNSGSGGAGAVDPSVGSDSAAGAGGGAGGYVLATLSGTLASTYVYAVGTGGSGGTAGTSGFAGGSGGSGVVIVREFYQ
jgi:hypothetical protein